MSRTLVIADFPIGYPSGYGETLWNLFQGFSSQDIWCAYPNHLSSVDGKAMGSSLPLAPPQYPSWIPAGIAIAYQPVLKVRQSAFIRSAIQQLVRAASLNGIRNVLAIPVSFAFFQIACCIARQISNGRLILFVMDDWQGHHECHGLPFTPSRKRLLRSAINASVDRFAISREMAVNYEQNFGKSWKVVHSGVMPNVVRTKEDREGRMRPQCILLAGDVNVFRFDAIFALGQALERHNTQYGTDLTLKILGSVDNACQSKLKPLRCVRLLGRLSQERCRATMEEADLLYLPLSFDLNASRISLYSLPTKFSEYLLTGRPTLVHAPEASAAYQLAVRHQLMPRLCTIDAHALDAFVQNWAEGRVVGTDERARVTTLVEEFNIEVMRMEFQAAFA